MFKTLFSFGMCAIMLLGGNMEYSIKEYLTLAPKVEVIVESKYFNVENIDELNMVLNEMLKDSYTMPAFGVSLDNETKKVIKNGVWLRFIYNDTKYVDEMNFNELLIEVNPGFSGFNIIRGNNGMYEGRCYYINLNNNSMKTLYNYLISNYAGA